MRRGPIAVIALVLVSSAGAGLPRTLPAGAVPGLESRTRPLPVATLAGETVDHVGLRRLLAQGGYGGGSEREFFGRTATFTHVTARVLRFGGTAGAARYLQWVRGHAKESLGSPRAVTALGLGSGGFVYRPRGCGCPSDRPTYLVAWRRGALVATLVTSGTTDRTRIERLARTLDRTVGSSQP